MSVILPWLILSFICNILTKPIFISIFYVAYICGINIPYWLRYSIWLLFSHRGLLLVVSLTLFFMLGKAHKSVWFHNLPVIITVDLHWHYTAWRFISHVLLLIRVVDLYDRVSVCFVVFISEVFYVNAVGIKRLKLTLS